MFNKLRKRIFNSIFWLAFAFVAVMSLVSTYVIVNNFFDTYSRMLESNVKQAALDCESYVQSVSNFTKSTAQRGEVVEALAEGKTENVSHALNTLRNSSAEIAGAILYGVDGRVFYSAGVGDVPTLNEVMAVSQLSSFFNGEQISCVSIRNTAISKVYNTFPYDPNNGVVSVICKVYDGDETVGYLFADILPADLIANKLALTGYARSTVILRSGNVVIAPNQQISDAPVVESGISWNAQRFVVSTPFNDGDAVTVLVSTEGFLWRCAAVVGVMALADAVCMAAVWVVARRIANRVTTPLNELRAQMQNENLL